MVASRDLVGAVKGKVAVVAVVGSRDVVGAVKGKAAGSSLWWAAVAWSAMGLKFFSRVLSFERVASSAASTVPCSTPALALPALSTAPPSASTTTLLDNNSALLVNSSTVTNFDITMYDVDKIMANNTF